jgi:SEC-C motif-containing protein
MRSRFTAYSLGNADYLRTTLLKADQSDEAMSEEEIKATTWLSLDIRATEAGGENDDQGMVEFVARYKTDGEPHIHHERAVFCREDGRWVYEDGVINPKSAPVTSTKVGRNDPCPCGSGKKYKKCCGA